MSPCWNSGTLGWGAKRAQRGIRAPGYKPEMEELDRRLGSERAARMFQLTREAMGFLEQLITEEAIACDFTHSGAVTLAAKPGHMRGLEESGASCASASATRRAAGTSEVRREIDSTRYHGGLVDPGACALQPAKYVAAWRSRRAGRRPPGGGDRGHKVSRVNGGSSGNQSGSAAGARVLAATNGYTPPALSALRRRVIPIGSYQIATGPLDRTWLVV